MGRHTVRILQGILGAISGRMNEHAQGNGGGRKMARLSREQKFYREELEKRNHKDRGRIQ